MAGGARERHFAGAFQIDFILMGNLKQIEADRCVNLRERVVLVFEEESHGLVSCGEPLHQPNRPQHN